ncbi:peptidoglycan-binding protein [Brasilonema sp. CT11]|nr:peptidoglycan-binding protein [Brasilonema sp. CT11]
MDNIQAQIKLAEWGLLDPPSDGKWGSLSRSALIAMQRLFKVPDSGKLDGNSIKLLTTIGKPTEIDVPSDTMMARIIRNYQDNNYWIARGTDVFNIAYVEGMGTDGSFNDNQMDDWNDSRVLFQVGHDGQVRLIDIWEATTQAGRYYVEHPMNDGGAAQIGFGQYWAWSVGMHGSRPYEALVQVADIKIFRDENEDGSRVGDEYSNGVYGINQHHGYDMDAVGKNSAGCLTAKSIIGHRKFMATVKTDRRYIANNGLLFATAVLNGRTLRSY